VKLLFSQIIVTLSALGALLYFHLRPVHASSRTVAHVENGFEFTVQAPLKTAAPLFGSYAERAWGGDWDPQFLYPHPPHDVPGEVFTVAHGHRLSTWVNTALDLDGGHIQYVYVMPDAQAVLIDIRLQQKDVHTTAAKVVYQRTALNPALNDHVIELGRKDIESGKEWESQINGYLQANKTK
jgi:hypothetical protein